MATRRFTCEIDHLDTKIQGTLEIRAESLFKAARAAQRLLGGNLRIHRAAYGSALSYELTKPAIGELTWDRLDGRIIIAIIREA